MALRFTISPQGEFRIVLEVVPLDVVIALYVLDLAWVILARRFPRREAEKEILIASTMPC
jgi:hypothetical protein